jgi:hypothetical protein
MRWWLILSLVAACAHGASSSEMRAASSTNPSRAVAGDLARAVSVTGAIARPLGKPVVVVGYLCQDRSSKKCPTCRKGSACDACRDPSWVFCDMPGELDLASGLLVVEPPPDFKLTEGQRYLLKGKKTEVRELSLEEIHFAD